MAHICVGNLTIIGPDDGLSSGGRQAIIWTNAGILLIGPWGTNFSEISIGIQTFSFKKMHFKMSSVKWRPFCLSLNVLTRVVISSGNGSLFTHHQAKTWVFHMLLSNEPLQMIWNWYSFSTRKNHYENDVCKFWQFHQGGSQLTHWGWVTHICVSKLTIIGSDNGLSPGRRQAIIWTNAGTLLIRPFGTNFSEILIGVQLFSFRKMELKMSSAKWRPFVSASMC